MASLVGQQLKDTYDSLLKTSDNDALGAYKEITDGSGNGSSLYLGTGGNVGIGVSPIANLHIKDGSSSSDVRIQDSTGTTTLYLQAQNGLAVVGTLTNHDLRFDVNDNEKMRIDSSGNVGIGCSPSFSSGSGLEIERAGIATLRLQDTSTGKSTEITQGTNFEIDTVNTGMDIILDATTDTIFEIANSEIARINSTGLGIGVTPATTLDVASGNSGGDAGADAPVLRISNTTQGNDWDLDDAIGTIEIFAKDTSGNSPYSTAFIKSLNEQANGTLPSGSLSFGTAKYNASGGAVERMRIDQNGNIVIKNTEATPSTVTDSVHLFAQDVSSSSELKVRDEAGNTTTLSPHNFSLIPDGASEDMAWSYYSEKNGKKINVDMLKLARMVEELTGETLVYQINLD